MLDVLKELSYVEFVYFVNMKLYMFVDIFKDLFKFIIEGIVKYLKEVFMEKNV